MRNFKLKLDKNQFHPKGTVDLEKIFAPIDIVGALPTSGLFDGDTDGDGIVTIPHGRLNAPNAVCATPANSTYKLSITDITSTTFSVAVFDSSDAAVEEGSVAFCWITL